MVEYRHALNAALVGALEALLLAGGGPLNIAVLGLTHNQMANWQKLRYWDLVASVAASDGATKAGHWSITERGMRFLCGSLAIPRRVWTYRGERVRYDGPDVLVGDVDEGYRLRADYAGDARPRGEGQ